MLKNVPTEPVQPQGLEYVCADAWFDISQELGDGLVFSEFRVFCALYERFKDRARELKLTAPINEFHDQFSHLCQRFSRQLELSHAGLDKALGHLSYDHDFRNILRMMRTFCEEACDPWYVDPHENADFWLEIMRRNLAVEIDGNYGFGATPAAQMYRRGFAIQEFDPQRNPPGVSDLQAAEAICAELTIDPSQHRPQEGFGRQVTQSDFTEWLSRPGARLFAPALRDEVIGFYIMSSESAAIPAYAAGNIRSFLGDEELPGPGDGWVDIVGLSKGGRTALAEMGFSGYSALTAAVCETARGLGIENLWGEVRVGAQANTARDKHLAMGWIDTGLITSHNGHPYELLLIRPFAQIAGGNVRMHCSSMESDYLEARRQSLRERARLLALYSDFAPVSLGPLNGVEVPADHHVRSVLKAKLPGLRSIERRIVDDCIVYDLDMGPGRRRGLVQKIPGQNLWKFENVDPNSGRIYYEFGLYEPMLPFEELTNGEIELR
ncbi:MAG: hypothetical protein K1X83_03585 [Oligoflexia bacterium]|nr:hypothetical protein [Oligoflexia bacterium]